ncbi:hypothetical protein HNV12_05495 [Methanococcoides sp. SA1]|nr:hypothetical protein [Methanococcoides sp. SA1]
MTKPKKRASQSSVQVKGSVNNLQEAITSYPQILILILISLLGIYLRIHALGSESLWLDEASSYVMVNKNSLSEVWNSAIADRHPPLHFLILHFVSLISNSEFMLRLPSAIFGIMTIPLIYLTGEKVFGKREGLISALILTISVVHLFYSQEARMYSQMIFFSLASFYFIYAASKENRPWQWAGFALSSALAFYSFYYTIFVLIPEILFYLAIQFKDSIKLRRIAITDINNFRSFIISGFAFLITISPLIIPFISQSLSRTSTAPTWGLGQSFNFFIVLIKQYGTYNNNSYILFSLFILGFAFLMYKKNEREDGFLLGSMILIPLIVSYILAAKMPFTPRHMLFVLPFYMLIISRGVTGFADMIVPSTPKKKSNSHIYNILIISVILLIIGAISFTPISSYYQGMQKNDWRGVSEYFSEQTREGDVIVILPTYMRSSFEYYYDFEGVHQEGAYSANELDAIILKYPNNRIWYVVTWDISAANPEGDAINWLNANTRPVNQITGVYILANN